MSEPIDIAGSCHCGGVKFLASKAEWYKPSKCNCTACTASSMLYISSDDLIITNTPSGTPTSLDYEKFYEAEASGTFPPQLSFYSPSLTKKSCEKGQEPSRFYFCNVCSTTLGCIANPKIWGKAVMVNGYTLDWASVGKDLKNIAKPEGVKYADGRNNTFETKVGEAFEHGGW